MLLHLSRPLSLSLILTVTITVTLILHPPQIQATSSSWYPTTVTELSPENFTSLVLETGGRPSFVHFYAIYSAHCKRLSEEFTRLALNYTSATSSKRSGSCSSSSSSSSGFSSGGLIGDSFHHNKDRSFALLIGRADTYNDDWDSYYGAQPNELYKYVRGGHPTILWFNGIDDNPFEYNGPRYADDMATFIYDMSGIEPEPAILHQGVWGDDEVVTDEL